MPRLLLLLLVPVITAGCTSSRQAYWGFQPDDVWTAMKAVAHNPSYDDWKVQSNDVWIDEAGRRIEVYRQLRRVLYMPGMPPQKGSQTWRLEITLAADEPPTARVVSRGFELPTNARAELDRYFRDVYDLLIGLPAEQVQPATSGSNGDLDALGLDASAASAPAGDGDGDDDLIDFMGPDGL